jgi:hypothetical protein
MTAGPFRHLCYPSGEYDRCAFQQLEVAGDRIGDHDGTGHQHRRPTRWNCGDFLDSEEISPIRFEAELSGFLDLLRRLTRPRGRLNFPAGSPVRIDRNVNRIHVDTAGRPA